MTGGSRPGGAPDDGDEPRDPGRGDADHDRVERADADADAAGGASQAPRPPVGEPEDAGPRPGMHPEAKRSGTSRTTALTLAIVLVLAVVLYAAITLGIAGSG